MCSTVLLVLSAALFFFAHDMNRNGSTRPRGTHVSNQPMALAVLQIALMILIVIAVGSNTLLYVHASSSDVRLKPSLSYPGWTPDELVDWKVSQGDNFTHFESGELCSCLLNDKAHTFDINCDKEDMSHVIEAWNILNNEESCATELGCLAESNNSTCRKNFFIVQAHHDHCMHSDVPTEIEKGYHNFDANCWHCKIERAYQEGFPMCPRVDCNNDMIANFAARILVTACGSPEADDIIIKDCCRTPQEIGAFRKILSLHDYCGPTAPSIVDKLLHDYEHACEEHFCNTSTFSYRGNLCPFNQYLSSDENKEEGSAELSIDGSNDTPCPAEDLKQCMMAGAEGCYVANASSKGKTKSMFTSPVSVCWFDTDNGNECDNQSNGVWLTNSDEYGGFTPPSEGFPQCLMPCPLIQKSVSNLIWRETHGNDDTVCLLCGEQNCQ